MFRKSFFTIALSLMIFSCYSVSAKDESIRSVADRVFALAVQKNIRMDKDLTDETFPRNFQNGKLVTSDVGWWCSGFYPGSLWLTFEYTRNQEIKELAIKNTKKLLPLLEKKTDHDIGFQIGCSFGNMYKLTGDLDCLDVIDKAADKLCERFSPVTGTIKSWDFLRNDWRYPVIIDNMMNLELLYLADELICDGDYYDIANTHAKTTMKNHFRDDYSSYHLVDYDPETGAVRSKETVQGYKDESAWARGQAWALYGYTMCYRETGDDEYLNRAMGIADYLISRLPEDGIPYWDFDSDKIPDDFRDASAGAIMGSAFAELSNLVPNKKNAKIYRRQAEKIVRTLASEKYLCATDESGNFLLRHCVGNIPDKSEVDVPLSYADYYFLESLIWLTSKKGSRYFPYDWERFQ